VELAAPLAEPTPSCAEVPEKEASGATATSAQIAGGDAPITSFSNPASTSVAISVIHQESTPATSFLSAENVPVDSEQAAALPQMIPSPVTLRATSAKSSAVVAMEETSKPEVELAAPLAEPTFSSEEVPEKEASDATATHVDNVSATGPQVMEDSMGTSQNSLEEETQKAPAAAAVAGEDDPFQSGEDLILFDVSSRSVLAQASLSSTEEIRVTLGRNIIPNATTEQRAFISRDHAVVVLGPGGSLSIEDRGTPNGTYVGGFRVRTSVPLKAGDDLNIGGGQNQRFDTRHTRFPVWSWRLVVLGASDTASASSASEDAEVSRADTSEPPAKKARA